MSAQLTLEYWLQFLVNIGVIAHVDAGKTTTTERMLYYAGETHRVGNVDSGNTVTDSDKDEKARGITIYSAAVTMHWLLTTASRDTIAHQINLIDTPGHVDFKIEVRRSLRVLDGAVCALDAVKGVQAQTWSVWREAVRNNVPLIAFINKMDLEGADFLKVVQQIAERLKGVPAVIYLPIGTGGTFTGIIDVLERKAHDWTGDDDNGKKYETLPVPADMQAEVETTREKLIELILATDDSLLERFLEGEVFGENDESIEELRKALRKATITPLHKDGDGILRRLVPTMPGSSFRYKGVQHLLDSVIRYLPTPLDVEAVKGKLPGTEEEIVRKCDPKEPLAALCFKIVDNDFGDRYFTRVYAGIMKSGSNVLNPRTGKMEHIGRIVRLQGADEIPVKELVAGDIGALIGLKDTATGDTLCAPDKPILLETIGSEEPVVALAITPKDKNHSQKMGMILDRLRRADPSFRFSTDPETGETTIEGLGELHLEIKVGLMKDRGCEVVIGQPKVKYRETIVGKAHIDHTRKKQTGGRGQFGRVIIDVEPLKDGEEGAENGLKFVNAIVGGAIPQEFIPAIEKGIRSCLAKGPLAGFPVKGIKVTLVDGKYHEVDSSAKAFEATAKQAFRKALLQASPVLMEPWGTLETTIIDPDHVGAIIGDINRRKGNSGLPEQVGDSIVIKGEVPIAKMWGYITWLRSATGGKGEFSLEPADYKKVDKDTQEQLLKDFAKEAGKEDDDED